MDRDRDRGRYLREGSVEYLGRGESYRPAGSRRSPPRRSSPPPRRSPPRAPAADTYVPAGRDRRRSRSPAGDSYRRRSRSPRRDGGSWRDRGTSPRRGFSPPRAVPYRARSPRRESRFESSDRFAPSSRREKSPARRSRDASPAGSRHDRASSPRGRFDESRPRAASPPRRPYSPARDRSYPPRSRSPRRFDRPDAIANDNWRSRRSPSASRDARADYARTSGRQSVATSRRSSPHQVHPSRAGFLPDFSRQDTDSPSYAAREHSPAHRRDSPPPRDRGYDTPPTGPSASFRNGDSNVGRAPPTGPAGARAAFSSNAPPSGPSMSAHNRNPLLSAPSRPRGGGGGGFGGHAHHATRDYNAPFGPGASRRPSGTGGMQYSNPTFRPAGRGGGPPTGPAGSRSDTMFRGSSNNTSMTYPRTQRFGPNAGGAPASSADKYLSDLPQVIRGGRKMNESHMTAKLARLEEEMERVRQTIADKEKAKREELRAWNKLERASEKEGVRSQMAEESMRGVSGDEDGGMAF